jgi:hypothetical protein
MPRLWAAYAQQDASSARKLPTNSAQTEAEEFKLEKRSLAGFYAGVKPFEEPCPRIETPWPGPISE